MSRDKSFDGTGVLLQLFHHVCLAFHSSTKMIRLNLLSLLLKIYIVTYLSQATEPASQTPREPPTQIMTREARVIEHKRWSSCICDKCHAKRVDKGPIRYAKASECFEDHVAASFFSDCIETSDAAIQACEASANRRRENLIQKHRGRMPRPRVNTNVRDGTADVEVESSLEGSFRDIDLHDEEGSGEISEIQEQP